MGDAAENHIPKETAMAGVSTSPATSSEVGPWVAITFSIPASSAAFVIWEMRVGSAVRATSLPDGLGRAPPHAGLVASGGLLYWPG